MKKIFSALFATLALATLNSFSADAWRMTGLAGGGFRIDSTDGRSTLPIAFSFTEVPGQIDSSPLADLLECRRRNTQVFSKRQSSLLSVSLAPDVCVDALLQTKWSQRTWGNLAETPVTFNLFTPRNYLCGCVATACSQIMYYWQWPLKSVGPFASACRVDGVECELASIAGAFDWNAMPLSYDLTPEISEKQREALGVLAYNTGVAVGMKYGTKESSAANKNAPVAFKQRFGYASAEWLVADAFTDECADALYASLDAKMPVYLCLRKSKNNAGHTIVADGYCYVGGTRYAHLNMGWAGLADVWYALGEEAVEGYDAFFSFVYNIHPEASGAVLSGRVQTESGGIVSGANVLLYDNSGKYLQKATSDEHGIYFFRVEQDGIYRMSCRHGSLIASAVPVMVDRTRVSGNRSGLDLTLAQYATPVDMLNIPRSGAERNLFCAEGVYLEGEPLEWVTLSTTESNDTQISVGQNEEKRRACTLVFRREDGSVFRKCFIVQEGTSGNHSRETAIALEGTSGRVQCSMASAQTSAWFGWTAPAFGKSVFSADSSVSVLEKETSRRVTSSKTGQCFFKAVAGKEYLVEVVAQDAKEIELAWEFSKTANAVFFDANGGLSDEWQNAQEFAYGEKKALAANVCRIPGWEFKGWSLSQDGDVDYLPQEKIAPEEDITLYAVWRREHSIVFHPNRGEGRAFTVAVSDGTELLLPATEFSRDGYAFSGWSLSPEGKERWHPGDAITPENDMELYAVWRDNSGELATAEKCIPQKASAWNGVLCDNAGLLQGTISVKIAKPKTNKKSGERTAKATAKIVQPNKRAISFKGTIDISEGIFRSDGLELVFGETGMEGEWSGLRISGGRTVALPKSPWLGAVTASWENGVMGISLAEKGRFSAKGMLTSGETLTCSGKAVLCGEWIALPIVCGKKSRTLVCNLWLGKSGAESFDLPEIEIAKPAKLSKSVRLETVKFEEGVLPETINISRNAKNGTWQGTFKCPVEKSGKYYNGKVKVFGVVQKENGRGFATCKSYAAPFECFVYEP